MPEYKVPEYGDPDFNYPNLETLRFAVNRNPLWFSPEAHALVQIEPVSEQLASDTTNPHKI